MSSDKLNIALATLNKKFGRGSVQRLGENFANYEIKSVSTGSLLLDLALGCGGFPCSRTIELYGNQASGKTSIALFHVAEVQKSGRLAAIIDAEHAFDPQLAKAYGVDIDNLIINQPDTGEEALEVTETLARTGEFGVIVIDSVSSLVPMAEAEAEMSAQSIGLQARLMSKALRKLTPATSEGNCTIIFINQIREKVGVMWGSPETVSGGRALAFYASIRVEVKTSGNQGLIKNSAGEVIGHQVRCIVKKNKTATPFKEATFNLIYGVGIDKVSEVITVALAANVIKQAGAWFSYKSEGDSNYFRCQGRAALEQYLKDNPNIYTEIEQTLRGGMDNAGKSDITDSQSD